jgi:hypothetical protein
MTSAPITLLGPRIYSPEQRGVPTLEAPLHDAAAVAADLLAPSDLERLVVIPELEIAGVRPDLWIGQFDEKNFRARLDASLVPCTARYPLAIAGALRRLGGEGSVDQLDSSAFHLGERRRIQRGISELIDRGLAIREDRCVVLHPAFKPAAVRGVGVEAKLGRWRKAVRQVQMWRSSVNGAWLVFPSSYLPHVPRQRPGMRSLGLAVVDDAGRVSVVRQARLTVGRPLARMVTEEHLYARWKVEVTEASSYSESRSRMASRAAKTGPLAPQ